MFPLQRHYEKSTHHPNSKYMLMESYAVYTFPHKSISKNYLMVDRGVFVFWSYVQRILSYQKVKEREKKPHKRIS